MELSWSDSDDREYAPLRLPRRVRLRTWLVLVAILCAGCALLGFYVRWSIAQERALTEIARRGGILYVDGNRVYLLFHENRWLHVCGPLGRRIPPRCDEVTFSDHDLHLLRSVSGLAYVDFQGSNVSYDAMKKLQREMPYCRMEIRAW